MSDRRGLSQTTKDSILLASGEKCFYCGDAATEVDHVRPWSISKDNSPANLAASCRPCNGAAGRRDFKDRDSKRRFIISRREYKARAPFASFAQKLRFLMAAKGLSLRSGAAKFNMTTRALSHILSGRHRPNVKAVVTIARAMRVWFEPEDFE